MLGILSHPVKSRFIPCKQVIPLRNSSIWFKPLLVIFSHLYCKKFHYKRNTLQNWEWYFVENWGFSALCLDLAILYLSFLHNFPHSLRRYSQDNELLFKMQRKTLEWRKIFQCFSKRTQAFICHFPTSTKLFLTIFTQIFTLKSPILRFARRKALWILHKNHSLLH